MKRKIVFITLLLLFLVVLLKYYFSAYQINYNIDDYNITEKYVDGKLSFEIENDNYFIIDLYRSRFLKKRLITKITKTESDNYICYIIDIKYDKKHLSCFKDGESISPYLIENEELISSLDITKFELKNEDENFKFYDNLDKDTYIALWNYNGFYIINNKEINEVNIFKNTKYDNNLAFQFNEYLLLPDYDLVHEFNKFKKINLKTGKVEDMESIYTFDYDSYISGLSKTSGFIFDNKYLKLYEINVKKNKITEVGNEEKGYIKIENNKKVKTTRKEYKDGITYFNEPKSSYLISDALYRVYNDKYKVKIFDNTEIQILKEYENNLYFLYKDDLYLCSDEKIIKIFHYFELNFNSSNMIYIFINN